MSLYSRHILPRLLDVACSVEPIARQRAKIVPLAEGRVVEIGIGSGHNLPHYDPSRVRSLVGVDPDAALWERGAARREGLAFPVERLGLSGESIPLDDACADTVVVTYSLCTIADPVRALHEMGRILRPGGQLLFCEHGRAPDGCVARWQRRIDPVWTRLAGGCHMGRDIPGLIRNAGFDLAAAEARYIPGPRVLSYTYFGEARPA